MSGIHTNTIKAKWSPLKKFGLNRWRTKEKICPSLLLGIYKRNRGIEKLIEKLFS